MTDPREQKEPMKGDEAFGSKNAERDPIKELDVHPDDADKVKGGRLEDPCQGGEISKRR
jgi:hypothetical protein